MNDENRPSGSGDESKKKFEDLSQEEKDNYLQPSNVRRFLPEYFEELPEEELEELDEQERKEKYREAIESAPTIYSKIKAERKKDGEPEIKESDKKVNFDWEAVKKLKRLSRQVHALRKATQSTNYDSREEKSRADSTDGRMARNQLAQKIAEIQEFASEGGLSLQKALLKDIEDKKKYREFENARVELQDVNRQLDRPAFKDARGINDEKRGLIEHLQSQLEYDEHVDTVQELEAIELAYGKDSDAYKAFAEEMQKPPVEFEAPATKKELEKIKAKLERQVRDLWDPSLNPRTSVIYQREKREKMLRDIAKGKDVLETPSSIELHNELFDQEEIHWESTIGAVLVGPAGTGKTTAIREYLESRGRKYVSIDLSEDVTRYLLLGSKSPEFVSRLERTTELMEHMEEMNDEEWSDFINEQADTLERTLELNPEQARITTAEMLSGTLTELEEGEGYEVSEERIKHIREQITQHLNRSKHKTMAEAFAKTITRNGWRDGVLISALRQGHSVILDEFNQMQEWTALHNLLTTKPGEIYDFADNSESIKVPKDWRVYFTGNIEKEYRGVLVQPALASRITKFGAIEVKHPPVTEELTVALAFVSAPDGRLLIDKDDTIKMYFLVTEVFDKARKRMEGDARLRQQAVPISYRTLRALAEKLIISKDSESGVGVYRRRERVSFDKATYDALISPYAVYPDKSMAKIIAELCLSLGLLLDESIEKKVRGLVDDVFYENAKEAANNKIKDASYEYVIDRIKGAATEGLVRDMNVPPDAPRK